MILMLEGEAIGGGRSRPSFGMERRACDGGSEATERSLSASSSRASVGVLERDCMRLLILKYFFVGGVSNSSVC